MKKIYLTIALTLFLVATSCEKTDSSLVGNWRLSETGYTITANEDFTLTDVFGSPWRGTIQIDGATLDPASFAYHFNNVWGQNQLSSQEAAFVFAGPRLEIDYKGKTFIMKEEYVFDILSGVFKVDGTAVHQNQSLTVRIDVTMPQTALQKGQQITVRDGYRYIPYNNLRLQNSGKLQADYLTGDIVEQKSGKWSVDNAQITIRLKEFSDDVYEYKTSGNSLLLFKDKTSAENLPGHISPFSAKIEKITYRAVFVPG